MKHQQISSQPYHMSQEPRLNKPIIHSLSVNTWLFTNINFTPYFRPNHILSFSYMVSHTILTGPGNYVHLEGPS